MLFSEEAKILSKKFDDARSEYESALKEAHTVWDDFQALKKEVGTFLINEAWPYLDVLENKPRDVKNFVPDITRLFNRYEQYAAEEQRRVEENVFGRDLITPIITRILVTVFGPLMGTTLVEKFGVGDKNPPMAVLTKSRTRREVLAWMGGGSLLGPGYFRSEKKDFEICEALVDSTERLENASKGQNLFIIAFKARNEEITSSLRVTEQKLDNMLKLPKNFDKFEEVHKDQLRDFIKNVQRVEKLLEKTFRFEDQ